MATTLRELPENDFLYEKVVLRHGGILSERTSNSSGVTAVALNELRVRTRRLTFEAIRLGIWPAYRSPPAYESVEQSGFSTDRGQRRLIS